MTAQDILFAPNAYRLKVEDYLLLDRSGAFDAFAKTELIEGVLVTVNAQYIGHARAQRALFRELDDRCRALGHGLEALFETSAMLDAETMPQPDIVVARDAPASGPLPREAVALIVEIADTTAVFDLGAKARVYAAAGVPEYWVADVNPRVIHQLWQPEGDAYAERREITFGEPLAAATVAGLSVETSGL